ncbi:HAD-IA family hydrolase [Xanthomonas sp. 60]
MSPMIELLLLDVDGVLLEYQRAVRLRYLADALRRPVAQIEQALSGTGLDRAYASGAIDTAGYLHALSCQLQVTVDEATWVEARVAASGPRPAVIQRLLELPTALRIAVLTNNGPLMAAVIMRQLPALAPRLRGNLLCSGSLGARKPDPAVFTRALQRLHATAQRTLFVDDLFVNVRGARQAGLHADTVHDARSLGRVLRRYLPG